MDSIEPVITAFVSVIQVHNEAGQRLAMKGRAHACIILPIKGKIRFTFPRRTIVCDSSHGILIPQGAFYLNECLETAESLLFNFQSLTPAPNPEPLRCPNQAAVLERFRRMEFLSAQGGGAASLRLMAELYGLLAELRSPQQPMDRPHPYLIQAVQQMVERCADSSLTIRSIAAALNISEVYLRRLFLQSYGLSPRRYLARLRMERARSYLQEGCTVSETALLVGYSDVYQFSRAFKRCCGQSPTNVVISD